MRNVIRVGLFVTRSEQKSKDLEEMLQSKLQGTQVVSLRDLTEDLNLAVLAQGAFDQIIVHVNCFNNYREYEILEALDSLRSYKESNSRINVKINILDIINPKTGEGLLERAYRSIFGGYVDCTYDIREYPSATDLIDLIRGNQIKNDEIKDPEKKINSSILESLSNTRKVEANNTVISDETMSKIDEYKVQVDNIKKEEERKLREQQAKETPKKSKFGILNKILNKNKKKEEVQELETYSDDYDEVQSEYVDYEEETESVRGESLKQSEYVDYEDDYTSEHEEEYEEEYEEGYDEEPVKNAYQRVKPVKSAVPKEPEVIDNFEYSNHFGQQEEPVNGVSVASVGYKELDEVKREQKELELRELELKVRMMEAQANIKKSEVEQSYQSSLITPMRPSVDTNVTDYVSRNHGRSMIILVTGRGDGGKTTVTKLTGEVLSEEFPVLDVDLDIEGRTLSNTFSSIGESADVRTGLIRSLHAKKDLMEFIAPVNGQIDALGLCDNLELAEEKSVKSRFDTKLIVPMLKNIARSNVYGYIIVDCPLDLLNNCQELGEVADFIFWVARGSRQGIDRNLKELSSGRYEDWFLNKLSIILNAEDDAKNAWKKYINTYSMEEDIADSLGAIVGTIYQYDDLFWQDKTTISSTNFKANIQQILGIAR